MIQTQDQLTAAMAGQIVQGILKIGTTQPTAGYWYSRWSNNGRPGAGLAPTVGINGEQVTNAFAGAIPYSNAVSGKQKYLSGMDIQASGTGVYALYDRLWQNSGLSPTLTAEQTIAAVPIPARDLGGSSSGVGVDAWLDVYSALGNSALIASGGQISYTNEAGVAGRIGVIGPIPATAVAGTAIPIAMKEGDAGIRSVESITLGTSLVSGTIGIVLRRRLASVSLAAGNQGDFRGYFDIGQKLFNGMALEFLQLSVSATAQNMFGSVNTIEG